MEETISRLVAEPSFRLNLLTASADTASAIDWIYSSDLADPTPFLSQGQLLLTTGRQFDSFGSSDDYAHYVERLATVGIVAVGFGTAVVREHTPHELVTSCEKFGIPLFEVPYETPFIALIRWLADLRVQKLRERDAWMIDTQRAVAAASLRKEGLKGFLGVLASRLETAVMLFDSSGNLLHSAGTKSLSATQRQGAARLSVELLGAGKPTSRTAEVVGSKAVGYTLGRSGALQGTLVLAGDIRIPDTDFRQLMTTVIALAELSLAQSQNIEQAEAMLLGELSEWMAKRGWQAGSHALTKDAGLPRSEAQAPPTISPSASELLFAPVLSQPQGGELLNAVRVWLRHNAAWDSAAKELGIHRHSLKNRVTKVADLSGLNLESFEGKAQAWFALQEL